MSCGTQKRVSYEVQPTNDQEQAKRYSGHTSHHHSRSIAVPLIFEEHGEILTTLNQLDIL